MGGWAGGHMGVLVVNGNYNKYSIHGKISKNPNKQVFVQNLIHVLNISLIFCLFTQIQIKSQSLLTRSSITVEK